MSNFTTYVVVIEGKYWNGDDFVENINKALHFPSEQEAQEIALFHNLENFSVNNHVLNLE
jgi:hypothetical protein